MRTLLVLVLSAACSGGDGVVLRADASPQPNGSCGSVRLTSYTAASGGWCEFDRTLDVLPASVRAGLTLAIAEPYNGGSRGGEPGEACGECWEIDSIADTRTVMVHDLCPIEGNPLCAGGHFHFDLSGEAADALHEGGLSEAFARRVPCPVEGNVALQISDRNEWGYLRFQVVNHRIPIRAIEYRPADGTAWLGATRSGGAWQVLDGADVFGADGPGGVFRLTSAQGEVVEMPNVLHYADGEGVFDLGGQMTDIAPEPGPACEYVPPGDVYVDGYGGIPEVVWMINPWGGAGASETTSGCRAGSCIRVGSLGSGRGFHIYRWQAFPVSTFATLSVWLRASSGGGEVSVSPSNDGERCAETLVTAGAEWQEVSIDVATACAGLTDLNALTVDARADMTLLLDDVRYVR
jgi:hypothetical protein